MCSLWIGKKNQCATIKRLVLLDLSELVAVTQDEVHMLIKCFKRPDEYATILQNTAHPVVDVLKHLTALTDRLKTHTHTIGI